MCVLSHGLHTSQYHVANPTTGTISCAGASEGATEEAMRNSNEASSAAECKQEKTFDTNKADHVFAGEKQ